MTLKNDQQFVKEEKRVGEQLESLSIEDQKQKEIDIINIEDNNNDVFDEEGVEKVSLKVYITFD